MSHHDYQKQLQAIWEKAVKLYGEGQRGADTYFNPADKEFLDSIGATAQEIYDFAEDFSRGGEPDFPTFMMLQDMRRSYFLEVQKGTRSDKLIAPADLTPKDAEVAGVVWLPRIIEKARAKLRGEMDPDLMYGCGGDRKFFRENDIHPSEFLRIVWQNIDNDQAIIDWVLQRRQ